MLKFLAFKEGRPAAGLDVKPSYLIGPDDVPVRGQVRFADGLVTCQKNTDDAAALAIMWEIEGQGRFLLQTTRLPDRDKPFNLNVELARWRLMRILQKMEDWGLFDYPQTEKINELLDSSRKLFIRALQNDAMPAKAAELADQSLRLSMEAGEALARFYSLRMLLPRIQSANFSRRLFGCRIAPDLPPDLLNADVLAALNYVQVPVCWAEVHVGRQQFNLTAVDRWFDFFLKRRISIRLGPVVSFREDHVPAWLKTRTVEYELLRDTVYEYLTAIAQRYGKCIRSWTVLSGIHAENYFNLNFEQILDISRVISSRAKQLCPRAIAMIEIVKPWGEYFAASAHAIHPFLYADMVSQSGINFDAFAIRLPFGVAREGIYLRDFFQISSLLDRFALLGKPLHLATDVPSGLPEEPDARTPKGDSGMWEGPWSPERQARWFEIFSQIAFSKLPVESITWDALADSHSPQVPCGGLLTRDGAEKPIVATARELQKRLSESRVTPRSEAESP